MRSLASICVSTGVLRVHARLLRATFERLQKDAKLRSRAQPHVGRLADTTIATRLLTTTLNIQEKLVTSKLRPSLATAADSAISEARCKSHRALNAPGRQIVLREETVALIVLGRII